MTTTAPRSDGGLSRRAAGDGLALLSELQGLVSEKRIPKILTVINTEDRVVPEAVRKTLPEVARAVDAIVTAFGKGGRLIYIGAGSSGRLGVLGASKCSPTFGFPPGMVAGLMAGGDGALVRATEGAGT